MDTDQFFATSEADFKRVRLAITISAIYTLFSVALRLVGLVGGVRQGSITFYVATTAGIAAAWITWVALVAVFLQRPFGLRSFGAAFLIGTTAFLFTVFLASFLDPLLAAWVA